MFSKFKANTYFAFSSECSELFGFFLSLTITREKLIQLFVCNFFTNFKPSGSGEKLMNHCTLINLVINS